MQPIVELKGVSFAYSETPVLENVDLHLHAGQFVALVGPSGAGKTSVLKLILGLLKPQRGAVQLHPRALDKPSDAIQFGYIPQLETVDWNFPVTVEQVVLMGRTRKSGMFPWRTRDDRAALQRTLEALEIEGLAKRHIRELSGGQQQRVFLARALIAQPDIVVLDEPTSGVDPRTAKNLMHQLAHLNRDGLTIVLTTHDLNLAAAHVPWVVCLNRRVIAQGAPDQVFTEDVLNETYRGEMLVVRHDGVLLVTERPHEHSYRDVIPQPVHGHAPDDAA